MGWLATQRSQSGQSPKIGSCRIRHEPIGSGTGHQPPPPRFTAKAAKYTAEHTATTAEAMNSVGRPRPLTRMGRVALALGLLLPSLDRVSDAFVFRAPAPKPSTAARSSSCRDHSAVVAAAARAREVEVEAAASSCLEARGGSSSSRTAWWQAAAAGFGGQRYRRQVG